MKLIDSARPVFKGNTHTHTTNSDGAFTPEEAIRLYRDHGYDFLVISDHWRSHPSCCHEGMLVMTGAEYDFAFADQVLHIVGVFPNEQAAEGFERGMPHQQLIDRINLAGGTAILAHPAWSLNTPEFVCSLKGICATEVYNSFSGEPWNLARADSTQILDVISTSGCLINMLAADDSHFYQGEQLMSYVMLQADELSPEGVIVALKRGSFYASQGPRILDAEITDTRLILHTSPVCGCGFASNLPWVANRFRSGRDMTEHVYELQKNAGEKWIRCEIVDEQGRRAWLSPVRL